MAGPIQSPAAQNPIPVKQSSKWRVHGIRRAVPPVFEVVIILRGPLYGRLSVLHVADALNPAKQAPAPLPELTLGDRCLGNLAVGHLGHTLRINEICGQFARPYVIPPLTAKACGGQCTDCPSPRIVASIERIHTT